MGTLEGSRLKTAAEFPLLATLFFYVFFFFLIIWYKHAGHGGLVVAHLPRTSRAGGSIPTYTLHAQSLHALLKLQGFLHQ